jgi:CRISPR-associated endonuclease/helicase Cas3
MIELELEPHAEFLADPTAEDYQRIAEALKTQPLYHQWKTYRAREADIVVNSYNTGTGKTKAALLRLLDLDEAFKKDRYSPANVLFIAPTNELLRQHEDDIQQFVVYNLSVDAAAHLLSRLIVDLLASIDLSYKLHPDLAA